MKKEVLKELREHIPFTAIATLIAILIVIIFQNQNLEELFHFLHPLHVAFSAIVTAGLFYQYKQNFMQALLIGITGSILIGSLSDIIFPWLGGTILNLNTIFHLPLLEEPILIFLAAGIGSLIGITTKATKTPHFFHVFLSVFASLFYLVAFSQGLNITNLIVSFFIIFIAVILPCCLSDIIYPLLFIAKK